MDDVNNLGSHELKTLYAMNVLGLWIIGMILGYVPMTLKAMNNSGLYMT